MLQKISKRDLFVNFGVGQDLLSVTQAGVSSERALSSSGDSSRDAGQQLLPSQMPPKSIGAVPSCAWCLPEVLSRL